MAKPSRRKQPIKILNDNPTPVPALLNTPAGMYAPGWDAANAAINRTKRQLQPKFLDKGNAGISRGR